MGIIKIGSYEPRHLSFSTVNSYRGCGTRFYLEKIAKVEQRPLLAGIGGNVLHSCSEVIDLLIFEQGFEALEPSGSTTT